MVGVDAGANPTEMIDLQALRYWANHQFVSEAMRRYPNVFVLAFGPEVSVALTGDHCGPEPTALRSFDFVPEAGLVVISVSLVIREGLASSPT